MKSIHTLGYKIGKLELVLFLSLVFSTTYGQYESSDEYYQQNIKQEFPSNDLPSESYYNANLRGGWDEDGGPGGSGEGENNGVGVPVGDGFIAILVALAIYSSIATLKKRKIYNSV